MPRRLTLATLRAGQGDKIDSTQRHYKPSETSWKRMVIPLRLRFGYKVLLSVPMRLRVYSCPLAQLVETSGTVMVPTDAAHGDEVGFFVNSQLETAANGSGNSIPGYVRYVSQRYPRYYIDLSGTFDSYLGSFSAKTRSTLIRKISKFRKYSGGTIDWREFRRPEEMAQFYELGRLVSAKTYQERLLDHGLPAEKLFLREICEQARHDALRGYILFCHGDPVSYLCCPIEQGAVIYRYVGYDPAYANHSVGTVLLMLVLERLFHEGRYQYFDFTEGPGKHKETFSTGHRLCADVLYLRPTIQNLVLIAAHATLNFMTTIAIHILDRLDLTSRLKRWLRKKSFA